MVASGMAARLLGSSVLDPSLLREYMEGFWGFGNPERSLWFVGMEQGGGGSQEELQKRLDSWALRGRGRFDDLHEYCLAIGERRWTRPHPPIQPTWKHLIRLALLSVGEEPHLESIRRFQGEDLGRRSGNTCLIELLPLPARNLSTWRYDKWTTFPELSSRQGYLTDVGARREVGLRTLIDQHAPRTVMFYGLGYRERWQRIVGAPFVDAGIEGVSVARRGPTLCFRVPHPVARGVTTALFETIGHRIRVEASQTQRLMPEETPP